MDPKLSEEFDTGVAQDEILAGGGLYSTGTLPGTTWKALVLIGGIVTLLGIVFEVLVHAGYVPVPDYYPTPLGSALLLAIPVVGIIVLIAGLAARASARRDPPLEPIV